NDRCADDAERGPDRDREAAGFVVVLVAIAELFVAGVVVPPFIGVIGLLRGGCIVVGEVVAVLRVGGGGGLFAFGHGARLFVIGWVSAGCLVVAADGITDATAVVVIV